MSKTKILQMRCMHEDCRKWFKSPIYFGGSESFDTSMLEGNITHCPHCDRDTGCNKENMRVVFEDGGFTGNKT